MTLRQWAAAVSLGLFLGACGSTSDSPEEFAEADEMELADGIMCGGFAGLSCPSGMICIDNPADSCSPKTGGADCSGICVKKKPTKTIPCGGFAGLACPKGLVCIDKPNDGCNPKQGGADCPGICAEK